LDKLTGYELAEWEAYDKLDPIGTWRDDFRSAKLESLMLNIVNQLYAKKGSKPVITTPLEFMPDWAGDRVQDVKKQTTEDMLAVFKQIAGGQKNKMEKDKKLLVNNLRKRKEDKLTK
jgi:hypothetical protein